MNKMFGNAITTMPQLAAAVIFVVAVVFVWGVLSMAMLGPSRAAPRDTSLCRLSRIPNAR